MTNMERKFIFDFFLACYPITSKTFKKYLGACRGIIAGMMMILHIMPE